MDKIKDIMQRWTSLQPLSDKEQIHKTDLTVGATPSLGAHASKRDIQRTEKDGTWRLIITPSI